MPELMCHSVVKELMRAGISSRGDSLTKYLESENQAPNWDIALVWNPEMREKYWQAMVALHRELVPNHISNVDLYRSLWGLLREVAINRNIYQARSKLDARISEFSKEVKKPLTTFAVIYEIKNFDIGSKHFNLGNVEIFKITSDYLKGLDLNEEASLMQANIFSEWVGRSVAKVEVNASEIDRAYESGIIVVSSVLNIMRLAAVRERIGRLDDEMFLWELGENITIPKVKPKQGTLLSTGYHRGFRPLIIDMGDSIAKGLESKDIWKYILDNKLPEDINRRVMRAMEWISHSITASNLDYKLVNLCSALEILLLPDYREGTKGELIALRQVLVGQNVYDEPAGILYLYDKRSDIIHGEYLDIASYSDYWHLLVRCLEVLRSIVHLSQKYPDIGELKKLLDKVENKETLEKFVEECERGQHEGRGIGRIKQVAIERLKHCQK